MGEVVSFDDFRGRLKPARFGLKTAKGAKARADICFDRREFSALMSLYSGQVAAGAWRDYALDTSPGIAVFSVFRQTAEQPLYTICKLVHPSGRGRQYAVFQGPKRLKLADSLGDALRAFEGRLSAWAGRPGGASA